MAEPKETGTRRLVLLVGGAALVVTTAAFIFAAPNAAKVPNAAKAAAAAATFARLEKEEAAVRTGRYSLVITNRQAQFQLPMSITDARVEVARAPVQGQNRETLVFSGADWRREVNVLDAQGAPQEHVILGMRNKVGRVFHESGHGDSVQ